MTHVHSLVHFVHPWMETLLTGFPLQFVATFTVSGWT